MTVSHPLIRSALVFASLTLMPTLSAHAALPVHVNTPDSRTVTVTFEAGQVIMLEQSREFTVPHRLAGRDLRGYYREVAPQIQAYGGRVLGLWDIYDVPEGIIFPKTVAAIAWPDMQAYRAFRVDPVVARKNKVHHFTRGFFSVPEDVTATFDTDLYYEWFGVNFDPVDQPKVQEFLGIIGPPNQGIGAQYGQRFVLMTLQQLDVPENTYVTDFAGLVEWPSASHIRIWEHSPAFLGAVNRLRNQAAERIDMFNGRYLAPTEWQRP